MTISRTRPARVPLRLRRAPPTLAGVGAAMALLGTGLLLGTFAGCFNQSGTGPVDNDAPASCQDGELAHGAVVDESQADCVDSLCQDGELVDQPDDTEVPDDGLECTTDACNGGQKSFQPTPGASCGDGGNLTCNALGQCEGCVTAPECGADSECRKWECKADHTCGVMDPPQGTPLMNQTDSDCQINQCNGVGGEETVRDDTDVVDDGKECTDDICEKIMPSSTPKPKDAVCSMGYCDGNGACVECNGPTQCGTATFCQTRTCTAGACGVSNKMAGTPLPSSNQVAGDCKEVQCDANGGTTIVNKDTDVPVDGKDCTDDQCSMGTPSNPNKMPGAMCNQNGGQVCDTMGACKKQNATACGGAGECVSGYCVDGVCCDGACTATCKTCNQTNTPGVCTNIVKNSEDNFPANTCNGMKACDGTGLCLGKTGAPCVNNSDCLSNMCNNMMPKTCL